MLIISGTRLCLSVRLVRTLLTGRTSDEFVGDTLQRSSVTSTYTQGQSC